MAGLYPNTPSTDGTILTPDLFDLAVESPTFDDQPQYKGHRARILDTELSNTPGQIKDRLGLLTNNLKVTVSSGLTLAYASGSVRLPNGLLQAIAGSLIVAPDNTVSYMWVDTTGAVQIGSTPAVVRLLLARVTAVSGVITLLEDLRGGSGFQDIRPVVNSIRSFGGTSNTNYVGTTGDVLNQGEYYYQDFTVASGVVISVDKLARIYCSGNVNIAGTINVTACATGGSALAVFMPPTGGGGGTAGGGFGGGAGELPADVYNHLVSPVGSGGGAGYVTNMSTGFQNLVIPTGGKGGGGIWIEAAGYISVTGTINANGENGNNGSVNTSTGIMLGGSGGGSGGLILLKSLSYVALTSTSNLSVRGGNGGNFASGVYNGTTSVTEPGSGGGGGRVVLMAPTINTTGSTINLSGGIYGTVTAASNTGGFGGTGGSYGGLGGHQLPYASGQTGSLTTRLFAPVG